MHRGQMCVVGEAQHIAEVVDLIAQRAGLELLDDVEAVEGLYRLERAIERKAERREILRVQFPHTRQ